MPSAKIVQFQARADLAAGATATMQLEFDRSSIGIGSKLFYNGRRAEQGPWVVRQIISADGRRQRKIKDGSDQLIMAFGRDQRSARIDYMRYSIRWHLIDGGARDE